MRRTGSRRSAWRAAAAYDRAPTALHRGPLCGVIAYPMMNLVMTSAPLAMKMCGLTVSDSNFGHSMAYRGDVRAELFYRRADRAFWRACYRWVD